MAGDDFRAEAAALRNELQRRDRAYRDLSIRHEELKALFVLASEQLDGVAERGALASMRPSDSEARMRVIAAESSLHEFLIGFSDVSGSIADNEGTLRLLHELRDQMSVVLGQLESAQNELAAMTERLVLQERNPGMRLFRRIARHR